MEPMRQRHTNPSPSRQQATPEVAPYADLLIDGEYVAKLRAFYRNGLDGLILGDARAFNVSLGFENGAWIVSEAAQAVLTRDEVWIVLVKHGCADWGDVGQETAEANFLALEYGGELRSAYHTVGGARFTIITNAERTRTTLQLEQELPR